MVRMHMLYQSRRDKPPLRQLGDPQHKFAHCQWTKTEIRLANDDHGYSYPEFEAWYGHCARQRWAEARKVNPVLEYTFLSNFEKKACHVALLRILRERLRERRVFILGRKVLTSSTAVKLLSDGLRLLIASFITTDDKSMVYIKRKQKIKNRRMA